MNASMCGDIWICYVRHQSQKSSCIGVWKEVEEGILSFDKIGVGSDGAAEKIALL